MFRFCFLENKLARLFATSAVLILLILVAYFIFMRGPGDRWLDNFAVEVSGFFLEILLFGVIFTIWQCREKIRNDCDQLRILRSWKSEEGILRKKGIIERLNKMKESLPPMLDGIYLKGAFLLTADFKDTNLTMANFEGAILTAANFEGARLTDAHLEKANMAGACLKGTVLHAAYLKGTDLGNARGLTWEQLEDSHTDTETKLPKYLEQGKPKWYKGQFGSTFNIAE